MRSIIRVESIKKSFKINKRANGLFGHIANLFIPKFEYIQAVQGISFEINEGEAVGFIGANGAGKSTTIKMLSGILYPDDGNIEALGYVPYKQRKAYVSNIGVIFGQGLGSAFSLDDFVVQRKLWDGSISTELLKPIDFRNSILAFNLGNIQFKLLTNFLPCVIITALFIGILPPSSIMSVVYCTISVILGFAILWGMSSIVQMTAFWILNVWSVSTLKNLLINVLAGASLPLWFMPGFLQSLIRYTPFDSIYFAPVKIYLGLMNTNEILLCYGKQIIWFVILIVLSTIMWEKGKKRIIIQGG